MLASEFIVMLEKEMEANGDLECFFDRDGEHHPKVHLGHVYGEGDKHIRSYYCFSGVIVSSSKSYEHCIGH